MESDDGSSSSTGHFLPVPVSSSGFVKSILAQLQSAYLFEESKHSFKYTAAFLIRNSTLEEKYNGCREKKRQQGYTDEDLKETYGFLLFDELGKAKSIGESGVLTGQVTCTTLGDPTKGVYLSMYSDCLDLNRWYNGKSGYIAILRLTQGRVKKVCENYTRNLTEPTVGFDCHVSEQLPSVSSKTSSFLAFERTQYYLYELLDNGSTAQSPSLACPYAVVAFSYTDTKETQQEKTKEKKVAFPYSPWMGKLQIGSQTFNVGIRSTAGALSRAKLPPVIKAERAISMLNIRKLVPKAIFDTALNGKALQEDLDCSLCEIVALCSEEKETLTPLLLEMKEKDVALIIALTDGGFLVLIHGSHFVLHDTDNGMTTSKILQGVFVFPVSQAIQQVTKIDQAKRRLPKDALRALPLLTYAEGEIEKTSLNTNQDLCEIFVQYMQSYATLISPGLPSSPFREVSMFPDQYDVPDTHGHLYSTPEWTDKHWQSLTLYFNNASSFQLPVSKASEIFLAGQEVRREDLEDDIYICLSSPEETSTSLISAESEDRPHQECLTNFETLHDTARPVDNSSQMLLNAQPQETASETPSSIVSAEKDLRTDEPSEELIVSITSAARTFGEEGLDVMKHDVTVTAELQTATLNSLSEIVQSKIPLNCLDDNNLATDSDTLSLEQNLECAQSPSLQIVKTLLGKDESFSSLDHVTTQEMDKHLDMCENHKQEKDKSSSKTTQVLEKSVDTHLTDNALLKELETCTLRKKSERWGLKPVISTCGRILIPYGSVDTKKIKSLKEKLRLTKDKMHPEERNADALSEVSNDSKNRQEASNAKESTKDTEEGHQQKCVGPINVDKCVLASDTGHLLEEQKENHIKDSPIAEKSKGEIMLKRLKSVILKKRNTDILRIGLSVSDDLENYPSPKRAKRDFSSETIKSSSDICVKETNVDSIANLPTVDPVFAHALGLTPKGTLEINCAPRSDPPMEQEVVLAKETPSCKQQSQSSPKGLGPRLKMLKKSQSISAEQVKKKWWLHFQTPTCYAEKQYEGCSRDISVRKTVKEKTETSSEALNLLADLALSANKEQVSPHPIQACLQELGSSLKKCEITKDGSNTEQQSVLHALLRQPASKPIEPQETPSPGSFGGSELVDVIYQEHAYSLPSSPLLLALPAPFQVSPLNGSSRLLHTQRLWDGVQTMEPLFSPEDKEECIRRDPEDPKRSWYKRKFCLMRTIVNKEKSVQVTRHWEDSYDFNLDSRFTVDSKDKTVVRALHGPWDFSIHDTTEEVQLIVHMWIGLFYSRSTARFFHLDSDMTVASSENAVLDVVDVPNEEELEQRVSEKVQSSSLPNAADKLEPEILDLSKPRNSIVDKEPVVLNLSQRQSNVERSKRDQNPDLKEKTQAPELSTLMPHGLPASLPIQWYWNPIHTTRNVSPFTYVGVPVSENISNSSELNHQLFIPVWEGIQNANIWTDNVPNLVLPSAELNDPETKNVPVHFPKNSESLVRKRVGRKRTQKDVQLSSIPHKNEFAENQNRQQVKENLPNMNRLTDTNHANEDVDSKNIFEIKKKYMKKLASINQHTSQKDKEVRSYNLLKKLLKEDTSVDTSKPQESPDYERNVIDLFNQNVRRQHVFAFPKAFATSIVTETTFPENRSEEKCFNIAGLTPLAETENGKCTSTVESVSVSRIEKKDESADQSVAFGCLPEFANQDMNIRKPDTLVENIVDCSLSEDVITKTVEASLLNKTNITNDEAKTNYRSVEIPFIGMNTSIEDMLKETTSNYMDSGKYVSNRAIASLDSCQPEFANQDMNTQNLDIFDDNTMDCSLSDEASIKTVEASLFNKANITNNNSNDEAKNNYRSVEIPLIGMNASIEDMLKEAPSDDMDKEKDVEHRAIASPHSCLLEFANQDMDIQKVDTLDENTIGCSLSEEASIKTSEASLFNKTNITNNNLNDEVEKNYRSVEIPLIGMNTSIEDMLKEATSDDMDKEKATEDMEIASLDSSLPEFADQDVDIRKPDTLVKNATDCSLFDNKSMKTVEVSLFNKTNITNNSLSHDAENNYRSVEIPLIGMNTSIEDMLKEETSNDMDEEKGVEDMEIASLDSPHPHIEVTSSLPTYADSPSHSEHREKSVTDSEVHNSFDEEDGEADARCPTPTIDEQPYEYMSQSNLDKVSQDNAEIPAQDEASVNAVPITLSCDAMTRVGSQSDIELRTLRTLQCLDEFLSTLQYKPNNLLLNSYHTPNTSIASNKKISSPIHDFKDMNTPSSMSDSCPDSTQCLCASPSNDILGSMQQPKENSANSLLCVSGMLTEVSTKPIPSTAKPEHAMVIENERPKSPASPKQCPDVAEKPFKMSFKQIATPGYDTKSKPIKFSIKKTKQGNFVCSGPVFDAHHQNENCKFAQPVQQDVQNLQHTEAILPSQSIQSLKSNFKHVTERDSLTKDKIGIVKNVNTDEDLINCSTSFVDSKTNKITDDSLGTEGSLSCTVTNTKRKGFSFLEKASQRCLEDNATQSSMDRECLIFCDQMKQLLKRKNQCLQVHCDPPNFPSSSPIIVQFSHLQEQDDDFGGIQIPLSFFDQKIKVDLSDREDLRDVAQQSSSKSLPHGELEQPGVSAITAECARLYRDIMDKICSGNRNISLLKDLHKTNSGDSTKDSCNYFDFCSQMKREMDDSFHNRLNSVVKKSCKSKNRFFLLVTSDDVFFSEARGYLEAEGHIAVQPSDFFLSESSFSPLLVIIRNEDIAEHIFKVPHLLQLRKSPIVQFAGIDEPDDVVNLTYQEVFIKGGFVMFDRAAVESLSPGNVRKILEILQGLIPTGKWKWVLHYRDSRRFKENARSCLDAKEKMNLLNNCKEDGLLDILPYHECDLMSKEQPNYLQCLCHQQVQNISARYPVFVSDSEMDEVFEKNGIVTMTVNSFLMDSLSKIINGFM